MEIFTLLTGVLYIVLEVRQKNLMWIVGVITSLAAMYMFWKGALYASFGLNVYYFIISFWGLYQWRKDSAVSSNASVTGTPAVEKAASAVTGKVPASMAGAADASKLPDAAETSKSSEKVRDLNRDHIHLNKLGWKTVAASAVVMAVLSAALIWLLDILDDPMSALDAPVAVLSAIATYWLSRSYREQWLLWIVADLSSTVLCLTQGLYWMSLLYLAYTFAAVYGYFHWGRHGRYV
ncbi:MAG: nicotinamide riboside transporter PnuC [Bacteroidales bacterium]|nr:nicotinamide riboside transporter PnuC [Bacteroidales bacterium]